MTELPRLVVVRNAPNGVPGLGEEDATARSDAPDYLRSRERAERAAAKRARSLAARLAHQELAQHYATRLKRPGAIGAESQPTLASTQSA